MNELFSNPRSAGWRATILSAGIVIFTFVVCIAEETTTGTSNAQRWPGFQGAGATDLAVDSLPLTWSPEKNIAWQTDIPGKGQSSPVIWGERIFATSIEGAMKNDCHIVALDLLQGKRIWDFKTASSQPVRGNYFQSRSAPTPVVDADRIYAFFETGNLLALTHDGKQVWSRSLTEDYGEFEVRIGLAASLLQTADSVIVLIDHEGPSYLLSVDKQTGETRWKTERFSRQSYASPALLKIDQADQIICSSSGSVDGYDPASGKLMWTFEEVGGNRACTPIAFGEGKFLISASPGMHDERLDDARKSNFAMQVKRVGDEYQQTILWKTGKAMPSFGSPMVHQGLAYWVNKVGVVYCFDAETGKQVYVKRLRQPCWATPLGLGDRIYFPGKDGLTTVIAAGPAFRILAENELFAGAAAAGDADLQRSQDAAHGAHSSRRSADAGNGPRTPSDTTSEAKSGAEVKQSRGPQRAENNAGAQPRTRNGLTFADPVQYGYAAVNGSLVMRTGSRLYCIRKATLVEGTEQGGKAVSTEGVGQ
ncbi:PQQ-binding-like beta-propeller repeat protein [uncultured Gimesia sp.]|jgi:outer membrane protein assembly factor BamB|uniref:outer membrane protein assembly factor BamB family protein n=1 Tax=uncultured Gimesia sp. TaxID=1678688 RepID=UPI0026048A14|nr:PQQ-binding-like beta-propeller repeat protein [uncultured Gimesia sp.]